MKVLFIDSVHPILHQKLEANGFECIDAHLFTEKAVLELLPECTGVVIRSRFRIGKTFIEAGIKLKFIARAGAGMENIDTTLATEAGIICINAPEGNRNAVAEHAIGMLLALMNKLHKADQEVRKGIWLREENRGVELEGKSVGIIGFGNTGSRFASKLQGFGVQVLVYDPFTKVDPYVFPYVEQVEMERIFRECDILSLHVPLTELTNGMVNASYINSFSKPIILINTSRGKVVNTQDLVEGMHCNRVSAVALDVLEYESVSFEQLSAEKLPAPFRYLISSEKSILSPHIAGWTIESHRKISEVLAEKILDIS